MAIKNINTDLQIEAGLRDGDGDLGTNNQVLISTGTGINWIDGSGTGIIGGPYLPLAGGGMTGTLVIGSQQLKFSDAGRLFMGDSNDLQIYHDGSNSTINNLTGTLYISNESNDGDIEFKCDNGAGGLTTYLAMDGGLTVNRFYKDAYFTDNLKAKFGSSSDLQIYHDGSNSYITDTGIGSLYTLTNTYRLTNAAGTENMIWAAENSFVKLYYDNSAKLETTNTGVTVTGELEATTLDINGNADISGIISGNFVVRSTNNSNADGANFAVDTTNKNSSEYAYEVLRSGTTVAGITTVGKITGTELEGTSLDINGNGDVSGNLTINGALTANGGITGLDAAGGISGNNYNITGVNQLTINDPGEGIVFSGTTNVQLFTIDDATDSILKITSATALDVNAKITNLSPGSANLDAVNYQQLEDAVAGVLVYQGTWNASTNTPALASGVGTPGYYYIVSTPGSTNLDGITDWNTGDWVIFSDQATDAWQKIDHTNVLNGAGTGNQVTKWSGAGTSYTLADSSITDNGTSVGIGTTLPGAAYKLEVNGLLKANGGYFTNPVSIFDSSATENPRLSLGRSSGETLNFDVEDRNATIYHKQDETTGIHKLSLSVDSDSVDTNTIDFNFRNSAGTTITSTPMTILSSGEVNISGSLTFTGNGIGSLTAGDGLDEISLNVADVNDGGNPDNFNLTLDGNGQGTFYTKLLELGDGEGVENGTNIIIDSTNSKILLDNGNVGIGTTSPAAGLQVALGGTTIPAAGTSNASAVFGNSTSDNNYGVAIGANSSGVGYISSQRTDGTATTYNLAIQPNGGNVGIGTASPLGKLQVGEYTVASQGNQNMHGEVSIFANSGNESLFLGIKNAAYPNRGWAFNPTTNGVNSDLQIKEHGSTGVRMAIQTGGNVGIGTTSPQTLLNIESTTAPTLRISNGGGTSPAPKLEFYRQAGVSSYIQYDVANKILVTDNAHASGVINYKINGSEKMRIDNDGEVLIGTTTPTGAKLLVDHNNTKMLELKRSGNTKARFIADSNHGQLDLFNSATVNTIRLLASGDSYLNGGNVGIGSTNPTAKLDVRTANGNTQSLRIGRIDAASYWDFNHAGNDLRIYNNGGTGQDILLGVNAAGTIYDNKVGIGTATPSQKLHVDGNARVTGAYYDSNNSPGTSGQILSSTVTGADWIDNAHIPSPAPVTPGSITSTIVGETIEIEFDESTTSNIDYYQVWSSDDGGDFGIIAQITPTDFSSTMTVVDTTFVTGGTMSYRVYAVKSGVYSSPGTTSIVYTVGTLDVTDMTVINLNTAYYIQYEKPASRFIDHIEIYMDSQTTQGALNRSNASIVYSGQNPSYMRSVGVSNNFHQFWVEVVTT